MSPNKWALVIGVDDDGDDSSKSELVEGADASEELFCLK